MKILLVTPIPPEYKMCKIILDLKEKLRQSRYSIAASAYSSRELIAVRSGPGRDRAASAVAAAIADFSPDIILDTGSCAGLEPGAEIGDIIIGKKCVEYGISGFGFLKKIYKRTVLPSAFDFFTESTKESLLQTALQIGRDNGYKVTQGIQASGEYLISSKRRRESLYKSFHAAGGNWETAGVYASALSASIPVFSIRVVTDLGKANALKEFYFNIKSCTKKLYQYISALLQENWFDFFKGNGLKF
jgi:nucleoside phosphorylase